MLRSSNFLCCAKLNCENRKLKYLSLSSRPCLDELLPSISDCISLEEESDQQDPSSDPFSQYKQQVKGKYHTNIFAQTKTGCKLNNMTATKGSNAAFKFKLYDKLHKTLVLFVQCFISRVANFVMLIYGTKFDLCCSAS